MGKEEEKDKKEKGICRQKKAVKYQCPIMGRMVGLTGARVNRFLSSDRFSDVSLYCFCIENGEE